MSKSFFRFMRGELNGYYIGSITTALNSMIEETKEYLANYTRTVFKLESEVDAGEYPMSDDMIYGIGKFTGLLPPRVYQDSFVGSIRFSTSNRVNSIEYAERGLFSTTSESFEFYRTNKTNYSSDINTLANADLLTSLVEEGATPIGYFQEGDDIILDDGSLDLTKLLDEPPEGVAYSPYYGDKYLHLSESSSVLAKTSIETYLEIIRATQWIRYNGCSIMSLCKLINIICPDYVFITSVDWVSSFARGIVSYGIDEAYETDAKLMRVNLFKLLVGMKFPQITLDEVSIIVTRDSDGNKETVTVKE